MNTSTNITSTSDENNYHIIIDESESEQLMIDDDPSIKPISKYDVYVTTLPSP